MDVGGVAEWTPESGRTSGLTRAVEIDFSGRGKSREDRWLFQRPARAEGDDAGHANPQAVNLHRVEPDTTRAQVVQVFGEMRPHHTHLCHLGHAPIWLR